MTLALYLSRRIAMRILAVMVGLLALGLSLDMLENSAKIIDSHGVLGLGEYALLRTPLILVSVLPFGVLIGAALAFLAMAVRNEMVVLRAAGYNTFRVLVMLVPLALMLGAAQNQLAVHLAPATELAMAQRFPDLIKSDAIEKEVWMRDGHSVVRVNRTDAAGATLDHVSIFETDINGALMQRTDARTARFSDGSWQLGDVTVQRPNEVEMQHAVLPWLTRLTPAGILGAARRSELVDSGEVRQILSGAVPGGRGTPFYAVQLWRGYAAIVVPMVMILFGAMASFGLARNGGGIGRVALGLLCGAAFVLADGVFGSLGEVGAMNAIIAAFLAPGIFFIIGLWSITVIEE